MPEVTPHGCPEPERDPHLASRGMPPHSVPLGGPPGWGLLTPETHHLSDLPLLKREQTLAAGLVG